jgi:putative flippase GtrA
VNPFTRWCRFNLVGAVGMMVQFAALGLFTRVAPGHYLACTAAAVEVAVLHNFVGHVHFTWRDRRDCSALAGRLVRFHLSNGLVSLLGNLAIMRALVHGTHLPLLAANGVAILTCSMVNFYLSHCWAFAERNGQAYD